MREEQIAMLLGGEQELKRKIRSELDFADVIDGRGIPKGSVRHLQGIVGLNDSVMAKLVNLSAKTYRARTSFRGDEGDHAYKLAKIIDLAEDAIGEREAALKWLMSEQSSLGGRVPLNLISNSAGAQVVEDILGRIKYGVYA